MKISTALLATTLASAFCSAPVTAQDGNKAPTLSPLELYTCNYVDGKSRGDLDKVVSRWNKWSDENSPAPYTAWLMTPAFFGPEITFDVAWMGGWPTNAAMGKGLQTYQDKGAKINAEFAKVVNCDQHTSMAVMPMQPPSEPTESALVRFMDCTVAEGSTVQDAVKATSKFGKYMDSKGSETNAWLFFPGMGSGNIEFDYKIVLANADYPSLAKDAEITMNGGGWMESGKTFKDILSCDSARVYQTDMIRNGAAK